MSQYTSDNSRQNSHIKRACVLGGGSFGTVLVRLLAENNCQVRWWMRDPEVIQSVNHNRRNVRFLSQATIPQQVAAGSDMRWALEHPGIVLLAVPGKAVVEVLDTMQQHLTEDHSIVATTKGIPGAGFTLLHEYLENMLGKKGYPQKNYALLSGPNIASEIVERKIAASVIATHKREMYHLCQAYLQLPYFRLFHNPDVFGVELSGVLKNVYAIVAGLADAHNMGCNTKSALIVRASAEITAFAVQLGSNPLTFHGMAGVGDLIVTCFSPHSRNYQAGYKLGKGIPPSELREHVNGVVEGIHTLKLVHARAHELMVRMPIAEGLHAILFGGKNYVRTMRELLETMHGADTVIGNTPQGLD